MMPKVVIKSLAVWLLIFVAAVLNGVIRDKLLTPLIGSSVSLPLSGIILSVLVLVITYLCVQFFGEVKIETYFFIGLFWVLLTLIFEYLFGHYIVGKPWQEINQVFNIFKGDLFIIVLIVSAVSPWLTAKLKGLV